MSDDRLADMACDREETIVTENKRDFVRIFKRRAAVCGGTGKCGWGVVRVPNNYKRLDIVDVYNRMKLGDLSINWEDVGWGNLLVGVGGNGNVTVMRLPICAAGRRSHHDKCPRCKELAFGVGERAL